MDDDTMSGGPGDVMVGDHATRRTVLRASAIGGTLLWVAPAVQAIGLGAANAEDPSNSPPPPPPPPPQPAGTLPSHGFVLVDCTEGVFAVKIDSSNISELGSLGNGNDIPFLRDQKGLALGTDYRQATAADKAKITDFGATGFTAPGTTTMVPAMYITLPAGCGIFGGYGYVFDGSFAGGGVNCGDGDKFTKAFVDGQTVYFATICNEPASGED